MSADGKQTVQPGMKKRRTLPVLPSYSHQNPSHVPEGQRSSSSSQQRAFSLLQPASSQSIPHRHRRYSDVNRSKRRSARQPEPDTQKPFFVGGLYKIPPYILRQLKEVERDGKLLPGHVEDIVDAELSKSDKKKSNLALKSGRRVDISMVEGSFRRIAGIREAVDDSGSFVIRTVEIKRIPGKSLGFFIRKGDGWFKKEGTFVSRVNLGSLVETQGLLNMGDEILKVNGVDITKMPLENIAIIMQYVSKLVLTVKMLTSVTLTRSLSQRKQKKAITSRPLPSPEQPEVVPTPPPSPVTADPVQQKPGGGDTATAAIQSLQQSKEECPYEVIGLGSSEPPLLITPLSTSTPVQLRAHKQTVTSSPSHECIRVTSQIYDDAADTCTAGNTHKDSKLSVPAAAVPKLRPNSPRLIITTPSQCEIDCTPSEPLSTCPQNIFEWPSVADLGFPDATFKEFSSEDLETDLEEIKLYSGLLMCSMYNLQTDAVDCGKVTCAISVDRLIKAKMPIARGSEEVTDPSVFQIDLLHSKNVTFTLRQDQLSRSGSITITLVQLFQDSNILGNKNLHLEIEPFGKLKVKLEYKPMSVAVKRMSNEDSGDFSVATFQDYAKFNPRGTDMPLVVEGCVGIINEHGLQTPGIYRMCASESAKMEAFGASISQTKSKQDLAGIVEAVSTHAFSGVIKDFFRTLPDPFFPRDFCSNLVQVAEMEDQNKAGAIMRSHVDCFPDEVTTTLIFLLKHFRSVCSHSKVNGMTVEEISKIFGPLMLTPSSQSSSGTDLDMPSYTEDYTAQAKVISTLMLHL